MIIFVGFIKRNYQRSEIINFAVNIIWCLEKKTIQKQISEKEKTFHKKLIKYKFVMLSIKFI